MLKKVHHYTVMTIALFLTIYIGLTFGQTDILAEDKSTSINCNDGRNCERTECVDGTCETIKTNSTNISLPSESSDKVIEGRESSDKVIEGRESSDKVIEGRESVGNMIKDKLNLGKD
jgi:hypothetical protein